MVPYLIILINILHLENVILFIRNSRCKTRWIRNTQTMFKDNTIEDFMTIQSFSDDARSVNYAKVNWKNNRNWQHVQFHADINPCLSTSVGNNPSGGAVVFFFPDFLGYSDLGLYWMAYYNFFFNKLTVKDNIHMLNVDVHKVASLCCFYFICCLQISSKCSFHKKIRLVVLMDLLILNIDWFIFRNISSVHLYACG